VATLAEHLFPRQMWGSLANQGYVLPCFSSQLLVIFLPSGLRKDGSEGTLAAASAHWASRLPWLPRREGARCWYPFRVIATTGVCVLVKRTDSAKTKHLLSLW